MFPTTEAGDYLNANLVSIKYNLDKGDADNIKETYGVRAYPTFIFLDGNGKEVARMLGGARDTKGFIARITETIAKENRWDARNARFNSDPSYAMDHIAFVKGCYMDKEADKLMSELFAKRSIEENFDKASLAYYTKNINDLESPIITYMLDNSKKVMKVMGKDEFNNFIASKANGYINRNASGRGFKKEKYEAALKFIGDNKALQTSYYKFMNEAKDSYIAKDFNATTALAIKYMKKASTTDRTAMVSCIRGMSMGAGRYAVIDDAKKDEFVKVLTAAASYEKDEKAKKGYNSQIESIKNPKMPKGSMPAMRMM